MISLCCYFQYYVAVFAAAHMLLMAIWLNLIRTNFCEKPVCEKFFVAVMALVWSFCFFNLKVSQNIHKHLCVYGQMQAKSVFITYWL